MSASPVASTEEDRCGKAEFSYQMQMRDPGFAYGDAVVNDLLTLVSFRTTDVVGVVAWCAMDSGFTTELAYVCLDEGKLPWCIEMVFYGTTSHQSSELTQTAW